jgi:hypothetical protein
MVFAALFEPRYPRGYRGRHRAPRVLLLLRRRDSRRGAATLERPR